MELTDKSARQLKSWLLFHEDDIARGMEDLGELKEVFSEVFGIEPNEKP